MAAPWNVAVAARDLTAGLTRLQAIVSPHVYEDVHEILMTQMLRIGDIATATDVSIHHCDQLLDQLHRLFSAASSAHEEGVAVVRGARGNAYRYCLFLRQFDTGAHTLQVPPLDSDETLVSLSAYFFTDHRLQGLLLRAVPEQWRVVAIENLRSLPDAEWRRRPVLHANLPMIFLGIDDWKTYAEELIVDADAIVVYVDTMSKGVAWELDAIARNDRASRTLVLATSAAPADVLRGSGRVVRCGRGDLGLDVETAERAVREFLGDRATSGDATRRAASATPLPDAFDFSRALPADVRRWAESNAGRMESLLEIAFSGLPEGVALAAAAAQSLAVHGWLAWNHRTVARGLSVFAGVQSLFGDRRSRHGVTRAELGAANMARARAYAPPEECDEWRARTVAALTEPAR